MPVFLKPLAAFAIVAAFPYALKKSELIRCKVTVLPGSPSAISKLPESNMHPGVYKMTHPRVEGDVCSEVVETTSQFHFFCKIKYISILMAGVSVNNEKDFTSLTVFHKY
jgi:hypothetical protein